MTTATMEVPETTLSTALAQHVLGIACFLVGNRLHNNRRQLATRMSHLRPVGCARWRSDVKDLPRGPVGLSSRRHSRKGGRKTRVRCAAKLHTLNTADVTVVTAAKATATYGRGDGYGLLSGYSAATSTQTQFCQFCQSRLQRIDSGPLGTTWRYQSG